MASQMAFYLKTSNRIKSGGKYPRKKSRRVSSPLRWKEVLPQLSTPPALTLSTHPVPERALGRTLRFGRAGSHLGRSMGGWGGWKEKDLGGPPGVWEGVTGASTLLCIKEHSRGPQLKRPQAKRLSALLSGRWERALGLCSGRDSRLFLQGLNERLQPPAEQVWARPASASSSPFCVGSAATPGRSRPGFVPLMSRSSWTKKKKKSLLQPSS